MTKAGSNLFRLSLVAAAMVVAALVVAVVTEIRPAEAATTLPPGFEDQPVVSGLTEPMDLTFVADGRMLVATKRGQFRVYRDGQLLRTTGLGTRLCTSNDHGLLGLTADPNFSANGYVYLFYTFNKSGGTCPTGAQWDPTNPNQPVNRISRFTMSGDALTLASEQVLVDNIPTGTHHGGGSLSFGKDGFLYASVGDALCDYQGNSGCGGRNDAARDLNALVGKILRVTRDGGIPSTNPYTGTDSARCNLTARTDAGKKCQEIFATGLRNPFRFAFDPDASGTRFFINDVGDNAWEEVDDGRIGADYGWNICEGNHDNPAQPGSSSCATAPLTAPIHEYNHSTGCASIVGGAFVPNDGGWPSPYNDSYLFSDHVCNKIFEMKPKSGGGYAVSDFASFSDRGALSMTFAPHGSGKALYYTNLTGGEVRRIVYTGAANQAPTADLSATPTSGNVPLRVSFDGSRSSDPDPGDSLSYLWNFGDGSGVVETSTPTTTHTYTADGVYTARLTVRDESGAQDADTVSIEAGNVRPEPTIESPAPSKLFKVGETIVLRGSATDPQDGPLTGNALSWEVRQWHNGHHYHPFASGTGSQLSFTTPAPEDLHATGQGNYLEIRLTATDSGGISKTVTQELQPHRVDVSFASRPSGLSLEVNGTTVTTPHTMVSWENFDLTVNAVSPQSLSGTTYTFGSWSNGNPQQHVIATAAQARTYTATYSASECTITGTEGNDVLTGTSGDDVICGLGGNDTIRGLAGNDTLKGGDSGDKLVGGPGNDIMEGGAAYDTVSFKDSASGVVASLTTNSATGEGTDTFSDIEHLEGSKHNDELTGSAGYNKLYGLSGTDTLSGLMGGDFLRGGYGDDTLAGGPGRDDLAGDKGPDTMTGDEDDDTLNSRDEVLDNDSVDGGTGTDSCTTDARERSIVGCP